MIKEYLEQNRENIINDFMDILKIPSVKGVAEDGAPFGRECANALLKAKCFYNKNGFETEYDEEGGYLLSYYGEGEKSIGIFAHSDTVPPGDGWIYTSPFEPLLKDGCIIGRGTIDNKSAVIISLYCAKILKELNIPLKNRLVLFTGSCEEGGMYDIQNYLSKHKEPDFSLVPDTGFPLFRGNKGRIALALKSRDTFTKGTCLKGGMAASVIGTAEATLPFFQKFSDMGDNVTAENENGSTLLCAKGIARHSATPSGGLGAFSPLCEVLLKAEKITKGDRKIFEDIKNMSDSVFGEFFGIEKEDKEYGPLTCVLTKVETDEDGFVTAHFNIRYGESENKDNIIESINKKAAELGWEMAEISKFSTPSAVPEDNEYVKALLNVYEKFMGHKNPPSYINAGGTYRQYLKNAVEIGNTLKWEKSFDLPKGHGGAHEPDEYINISGLLKAIEVTILMLLEIDKMLSEK